MFKNQLGNQAYEETKEHGEKRKNRQCMKATDTGIDSHRLLNTIITYLKKKSGTKKLKI